MGKEVKENAFVVRNWRIGKELGMGLCGSVYEARQGNKRVCFCCFCCFCCFLFFCFFLGGGG